MRQFHVSAADQPELMNADQRSDRGPYMSLATAMERYGSMLAAEGLFAMWRIEQANDALVCVCQIHHVCGHTEEIRCSILKAEIQEILPPSTTGKEIPMVKQIGAAIAYLQRYTFFLGLGIVVDKDTSPTPTPTSTPTPTPRPRPRRNTDTKSSAAKLMDEFRLAVAELPQTRRDKINELVVAMSPTGKKADFPVSRADEIWTVIDVEIATHAAEMAADPPPGNE